MGAAALARYAEELIEQLDDIDTRSAGDAAVKVMRQATAAVIGGDLSMSGLKRGGPARIEAKSGPQPCHRRDVRRRLHAGRQGPPPCRGGEGAAGLGAGDAVRAAACRSRGSTTAGAHITDRAGPKALDEAAERIVDDLEWGS